MENQDFKKGLIVEIPKIWLIPLLCLLVIFGTVAVAGIVNPSENEDKTIEKTSQSQPTIQAKAVFSFSPTALSLKEGESGTFDLNIFLGEEIFLDGVDIVLTFDPQIVEITEVVPSEIFSFNNFRKEDLSKGRISITFLEERGGGAVISGLNKLATVNLKAKKAGQSEISILKAEKGATTVVVESGTSKKIEFNAQNLTITAE